MASVDPADRVAALWDPPQVPWPEFAGDDAAAGLFGAPATPPRDTPQRFARRRRIRPAVRRFPASTARPHAARARSHGSASPVARRSLALAAVLTVCLLVVAVALATLHGSHGEPASAPRAAPPTVSARQAAAVPSEAADRLRLLAARARTQQQRTTRRPTTTRRRHPRPQRRARAAKQRAQQGPRAMHLTPPVGAPARVQPAASGFDACEEFGPC